MKPLTRESLIQAAPRPKERVEIPELESFIYVQGMTAGERSRFEMQFTGKNGQTKNTATLRERLLVQTVCDEAGNPILTAEDIAALGQQSAVIIERLVNVAMRLCGMSGSDIEDIEGN